MEKMDMSLDDIVKKEKQKNKSGKKKQGKSQDTGKDKREKEGTRRKKEMSQRAKQEASTKRKSKVDSMRGITPTTPAPGEKKQKQKKQPKQPKQPKQQPKQQNQRSSRIKPSNIRVTIPDRRPLFNSARSRLTQKTNAVRPARQLFQVRRNQTGFDFSNPRNQARLTTTNVPVFGARARQVNNTRQRTVLRSNGGATNRNVVSGNTDATWLRQQRAREANARRKIMINRHIQSNVQSNIQTNMQIDRPQTQRLREQRRQIGQQSRQNQFAANRGNPSTLNERFGSNAGQNRSAQPGVLRIRVQN